MLGDLLQETGFDASARGWLEGDILGARVSSFLPALPSLEGETNLAADMQRMVGVVLLDGNGRTLRRMEVRGGEWSQYLAILCVRFWQFLSTSRAVRLILQGAMAWTMYVLGVWRRGPWWRLGQVYFGCGEAS